MVSYGINAEAINMFSRELILGSFSGIIFIIILSIRLKELQYYLGTLSVERIVKVKSLLGQFSIVLVFFIAR